MLEYTQDEVGDFAELNDYLIDVIPDTRREPLIALCQNLTVMGNRQLQGDVETLLQMSNVGEADLVLMDLQRLLFQHAFERTQEMGFNWIDEIKIDDLLILADVIQGALLLQDTEDYGDLSAILDSDDAIELKVVDLWGLVLEKEFSSLLEYVYFIDPEVLTRLHDVITTPYPVTGLEAVNAPEHVLDRLTYAVGVIPSVVVEDYVTQGGALALTLPSLVTYFTPSLIDLADPAMLLNELVWVVLVSDTPDALIRGELQKLVDYWIHDPDDLSKIAKQLNDYPW